MAIALSVLAISIVALNGSRTWFWICDHFEKSIFLLGVGVGLHVTMYMLNSHFAVKSYPILIHFGVVIILACILEFAAVQLGYFGCAWNSHSASNFKMVCVARWKGVTQLLGTRRSANPWENHWHVNRIYWHHMLSTRLLYLLYIY